MRISFLQDVYLFALKHLYYEKSILLLQENVMKKAITIYLSHFSHHLSHYYIITSYVSHYSYHFSPKKAFQHLAMARYTVQSHCSEKESRYYKKTCWYY